jgi:ankyrin repeat protein
MATLELHREVKRGNTTRVQGLLRNGAEPNATDRAGYTPLMYALESLCWFSVKWSAGALR